MEIIIAAEWSEFSEEKLHETATARNFLRKSFFLVSHCGKIRTRDKNCVEHFMHFKLRKTVYHLLFFLLLRSLVAALAL